MSEKNIKYYLISHYLLAKVDNGFHYLYENSQWVKDDKKIIWDRLHGYDSTEHGTGYDTWVQSIMDTIQEITEAEALEMIQKSSK